MTAEQCACRQAEHENGHMSLRDLCAVEAMAVMLAEGTWPDNAGRADIAKRAYLIADAMLRARDA